MKPEDGPLCPKTAIPLFAPQPLLAFAIVARRFYPDADGMHAPSAGYAVHPTAKIAEGVEKEIRDVTLADFAESLLGEGADGVRDFHCGIVFLGKGEAEGALHAVESGERGGSVLAG